jgi:hypothetical protein
LSASTQKYYIIVDIIKSLQIHDKAILFIIDNQSFSFDYCSGLMMAFLC